MTVQATWQRYLRVGKESTWGTAPTGAIEYNGTGNWYSFITESPIGALKYHEAKIRTRGAVGARSTDQYAPVPGATKSDGSLDIPFVSNIGGLFLTAALGSDSAADTNDTTIKASTALSSSPQTINTFDAQPTTNVYPYFKFAFTLAGGATFGATGSVAVTGTNDNDETITETVTFGAQTGAFNAFTQLGFKTITEVIITGVTLGGGSGTVTTTSITYTTHTITAANTSSSLAIEENGDPGAGSGNSWLYTGMSMTALALSFNVVEEEGLFSISPTLEGKYPTS